MKNNKKESDELAKCAAEIVGAIAESCQSCNGGPDEGCVNYVKDLHRCAVHVHGFLYSLVDYCTTENWLKY